MADDLKVSGGQLMLILLIILALCILLFGCSVQRTIPAQHQYWGKHHTVKKQ
jgi:hypothetical protein